MEQAFSADVLVPLGVGAAALVVAIVIVIARAIRGRSRATAPAEPTHADWTGESVGTSAEPRAAEAPAKDMAMAGGGAPPRPTTVADMVAVREADTAPLPVQSDVLLARARAHRAAAEEAARQASIADQGAAEVEADAADGSAAETGEAVETAETGDAVETAETGGAAEAGMPGEAAEVPAEAPAAPLPSPRPAPVPRPLVGSVGPDEAPVGDTRSRSAEPVDATAPVDAAAPADERPSAAQLAALGAPPGVAAVPPWSRGSSATTDMRPTADRPASAAPAAPEQSAAVPETGSVDEPGPSTTGADPAAATTGAHPAAATADGLVSSSAETEPVPSNAETQFGDQPVPPTTDAQPAAAATEDEAAAREAGSIPVAASVDPTGAEQDHGIVTPAQAWPVVARPSETDHEPDQEPDQKPGQEHGQKHEENAGSSQAVASAVQNALAARARAAQAGQVDLRRGDARDRLLSVLLPDPARAVGATVDLQAQQAELARIAEAMRAQREELGAVVRRLAAAGLSADQVAKLAGLDADEVAELLGRAPQS